MIELYTKDACAYCTWTKALLEKKGFNYNERKLGTLKEDGQLITREYILNNFPNSRTFPIILVDGNNIGGYEGLQTYLNRNEALHHNNIQLLVD